VWWCAVMRRRGERFRVWKRQNVCGAEYVPPLTTMSFSTGGALATVVNPDEARRRDNREFRARSDQKADVGGRRERRAAGRDGDFET
jgi:hypothetical protein